MKILLDENIDEEFVQLWTASEVAHVKQIGWHGCLNGEPLRRAENAAFNALVTADKNMPYQQSIVGRKISLFVLDIHPTCSATRSPASR